MGIVDFLCARSHMDEKYVSRLLQHKLEEEENTKFFLFSEIRGCAPFNIGCLFQANPPSVPLLINAFLHHIHRFIPVRFH